jgi:hypothetical protein
VHLSSANGRYLAAKADRGGHTLAGVWGDEPESAES